MKYATTALLLLLGATASCDAFVATTAPRQSTTTLAGYHYRNGPDPDPSSMSGVTPALTKGVKPVFPTYGTPEASPPLGEVGGDPFKHKLKPEYPDWEYKGSNAPLGEVGGDTMNKKGLNRVFLDWEDRGFSADGLQRQSS